MLKSILAPLAIPIYCINRLTSYVGLKSGLFAYYDLILFRRKYKNSKIPLSGYQFHRWQLLNQHTHKQYRAIWLICVRYMRSNVITLHEYYTSVMLVREGEGSDETKDMLTPYNVDKI